ncbi:MAG: methyl-accepting chemotaxis protein [Planctomycetaceae bacterium]|jgi:methyl-accepting chemotaxis protein|nr:methyl-accepting chemotaxis protein [Planctomycetaceae bacterium]
MSNFKLSTQLVLILSVMTLLVSVFYFGLIFYSQRTTGSVFDNSMAAAVAALETAKNKLEKDLGDNIGEVNKDVQSSVQSLSRNVMANLARQVAAEVALSVEGTIGQTTSIADTFKTYMEDTPKEKYDRQFILNLIDGVAEKPECSGAGLCFEPNAFDGKDEQFKGKTEMGCDAKGRFIPWGYRNKDGKVAVEPLEEPDTSDYYTVARDTKQIYITPPYLYNGIVMITVSVPFLNGDKLLGVTTTDLAVSRIENILRQYKPFGSGFAFLVDEAGVIVWHPNKDYVLKNLKDIPGRAQLLECVKNDKFDQMTITDPPTGKAMFQTYVPVRFSGCKNSWGVIISANVEDYMNAAEETGGKLTTLRNAINSHINNLVTDIEKADKETDSKMGKNNTEMMTLVAGVSLGIILLSVGVAFVVGRSFAAPIVRSVAVLRSIAGEGDLSEEVPAKILARGDEIGEVGRGIKQILDDYRTIGDRLQRLAGGDWTETIQSKGPHDLLNQHFAAMYEQVNKTLREISEKVMQVNSGSGEVASASESLSGGAQESAASLEEISASMNEISSQTKVNAASAGSAKELAQKASQAASEGQNAMQQMNTAMNQITKNSDEIQRVIKVIDDIAFQTNLLALNAAVEAARAGAHGKGFAVVAEEVRNLAARSAKAAKETTDLINTSGQEIKRGGDTAVHTSNVLNTIVEQIKQTTDLIAEIAAASSEQAEGVNQVTVGLQQIDSVIQQNTAAAEESASAAGEMKATAAGLQQIVSQFKLR